VVVLSSFAFAVAAAPATAATTHNVSLVGFSYSPATLTIAAGDTVIWKNNSAVAHTVTADHGSFDSGSLAPGETFSHTFPTAATVAYHCSFHGAVGGIGMAGTIVVRSSAPPTTAPPVTSPAAAPPGTAPPATTPASAPATPAPPAAAPSAPAGAVTPLAGTTSSTSQPELAHTGSNSAATALVAAAFLVAGAALMFGRRRTRLDRQG
jgi:LPXTG-motif cell wall-anchored protein